MWDLREVILRDQKDIQEDNKFRQIVCLTIVKVGNKFLLADRILDGKVTQTGLFGGHITAFDFEARDDYYEATVRRELLYRFDFKGGKGFNIEPKLLGYINLRNTPKSRLHLAVIFITELPGKVRVKSYTDKFYNLVLKSYEEIDYDSLDEWSRIIYKLGKENCCARKRYGFNGR